MPQPKTKLNLAKSSRLGGSDGALLKKRGHTDLLPRRKKPTEEKDIQDSYPLIVNLIQYLKNEEAFLQEGIFRTCGDYSSIHSAKEVALMNQTCNYIELFESLGLISTADVLKLVLRSLFGPLVKATCLRKLRLAPEFLSYNDSSDISVPYDEAVALYINSTLSMLTHKRFDIIQKLLFLLLRVIANESTSRMGIANVATIFAPILFGTPDLKGASCDSFVTENAKLVDLLQFIILHQQKYPKHFKHKSNMLQDRYATQHFVLQDKQFVVGEKISVFHRGMSFVLALFKKRIFKISTDILRTSFSPLKPTCDSSMLRATVSETSLRNKKHTKSKSVTHVDHVQAKLLLRGEVLPLDSLVRSFPSLCKLNDKNATKFGSTSYRGSCKC